MLDHSYFQQDGSGDTIGELESATVSLLIEIFPDCSCSITNVSSIEQLSCPDNETGVVAGTGNILFADLEHACAQFSSFENGSWIPDTDNLTLLDHNISSFNLKLTSSCVMNTTPPPSAPEKLDILLVILLISCSTAGGTFLVIVAFTMCLCLIAKKCTKKSNEGKEK